MGPKKPDTKTSPVIEIAKKVTPEVKVAATKAILGEKVEISEVLCGRKDETLALVQKLLASAGINGTFTLPETEGDANELQVELNNATTELSPEILESCLRGLKSDFNRGTVVSDKTALEVNYSAGTTWETVQERLLANDKTLLKKAATMQGKGELIGIFKNGELCIIDRADVNGNREPVITAFNAVNKRITITTDTPDRARVIQDIKDNGRFANYWEIRIAVYEDGFTLPPDSPEYEKKGIVAAVEAVSGKPFVRSQNGKEWRSAILDCGNVSKSTDVRVVHFHPSHENTDICIDVPRNRRVNRGAVRVLRG